MFYYFSFNYSILDGTVLFQMVSMLKIFGKARNNHSDFNTVFIFCEKTWNTLLNYGDILVTFCDREVAAPIRNIWNKNTFNNEDVPELTDQS